MLDEQPFEEAQENDGRDNCNPVADRTGDGKSTSVRKVVYLGREISPEGSSAEDAGESRNAREKDHSLFRSVKGKPVYESPQSEAGDHSAD